MKVRKATIDEFKKLWNYSNSNTYKYFLSEIERENVEFWTIDDSGNLIGELYIFWNSLDKDEADGFKRAYLCAFRISKEHQGKGLGSKLMSRVLSRIKEKGYSEVTIGIDNEDYDKLNAMYKNFGFTEYVKDKLQDDHYIGPDGKPLILKESYKIALKKI